MSRTAVSALGAIDQGCELVRRCGGWAGVLVLSALPARLLLVLLLWEAWKLGDDSRAHGNALSTIAWLALAAWLVSLAGRLVFVNACRIAAEGEQRAPARVMRVPWSWMWALLRTGVTCELLWWLTIPTFILAPGAALAAGISAAQAPHAGAAPFRVLLASTPWPALVRLGLCFIPAVAAAIFAVIQGAGMIAWACEALPWVQPGTWTTLLTWQEPLFLMLACAGGTLLVEPFWIASLVVLDRQAQSRSSGDDLRAWFAAQQAARASGAP